MDFQLQDFNLHTIQITEILNTINQDSVFCSLKYASNRKSCEHESFVYNVHICEEYVRKTERHFGNFSQNCYNTYV